MCDVGEKRKKNAKKMSVSIWPVTGRIINVTASKIILKIILTQRQLRLLQRCSLKASDVHCEREKIKANSPCRKYINHD